RRFYSAGLRSRSIKAAPSMAIVEYIARAQANSAVTQVMATSLSRYDAACRTLPEALAARKLSELNPQSWDHGNLNDVRWYACMPFEERLAYLDWLVAERQAKLDAHNAVRPDGDKFIANKLAVRLWRVQRQRRIALLDREPLPDWYQDYRRYLGSGRWRRIRRRKLVSVHHRCEHPGCKRSATACHHKHYDTLGFEENSDLEALCSHHHQARHSNGQARNNQHPLKRKVRSSLQEIQAYSASLARAALAGDERAAP